MKNVQPAMNVGKQRRKLIALLPTADTNQKREYVFHLIGLFDAAVEDGQPQPASQFIPMYEEEFDL